MHYYETKLLEAAEKNPEVIVMTAENRFSMRNIPSILGDKFIDVGIMEQNMVGIAAGLSASGKIPIMHALAAFLTMRSFEFIRTDLGYPNLKSIIAGTFTGFISQGNGPAHQAIEDIGLMRIIPNVSVFAPSNIYEMCKIFEIIKDIPGPVYLRYLDDTEVNYGSENFKFGKNLQIKDGEDVAILSYGTLLKNAVKASQILESKDINASVYNFRFLKPFDAELLNTIFSKYKKIVVIEDHYALGGLTSIIKEESFNNNAQINLLEINLKNNFFKPALLNDVIDFEGFNPNQIAEKIIKFLNN